MNLLHPVLDWSSLSQRQRWAEKLCSRQARCFGDAAGCRWGGCSLFIHGGSPPGRLANSALCLFLCCSVPCGASNMLAADTVAGAPKIPSCPGKTAGIKFVATQGLMSPFHRNLASVICLLFLSQRALPFSLWFFEDSKTSLLFSVSKRGHVCKINNPKIMRGSWTDLKRPHLE